MTHKQLISGPPGRGHFHILPEVVVPHSTRALTGHRTVLQSSVKADIIIGLLTYCGDNTFGRIAGFGHSVAVLPSGPHRKHCGLTDSACNSLTRRAVAMANKKADLRESHVIAASVKGSNGAQEKLLKTKFRSHCGTILDPSQRHP